MKFSVIISGHDDYVEKLRNCLESIETCGERGIEIILVLSGPVLSSFKKIRREHDNCRTIYSRKTLSPSKARNAGAKKANGDWLVFIDSDCIISKAYFSELRKSITAKAPPDCIVGKVLSTDNTLLGRFEEFEHAQSLRKYLYEREGRTFAKICVGANMAIKRNLFRHVGGFGEKLNSAEDRELGARLFLNGYDIEYLDKLTAHHKYHTSLLETIRRHLWHVKGNKVLYAKYPQVFKKPLMNRFSLVADAFAAAVNGTESRYCFVFACAISFPYILKFAFMRLQK
jgi:GT2 family glycosyltransferase